MSVTHFRNHPLFTDISFFISDVSVYILILLNKISFAASPLQLLFNRSPSTSSSSQHKCFKSSPSFPAILLVSASVIFPNRAAYAFCQRLPYFSFSDKQFNIVARHVSRLLVYVSVPCTQLPTYLLRLCPRTTLNASSETSFRSSARFSSPSLSEVCRTTDFSVFQKERSSTITSTPSFSQRN